jgi:hypothetical protein
MIHNLKIIYLEKWQNVKSRMLKVIPVSSFITHTTNQNQDSLMVNHWLLAVQGWVWSQASPHGICGWQSGTGTDFFLWVFWFCHQYHSANALYPVIHLIPVYHWMKCLKKFFKYLDFHDFPEFCPYKFQVRTTCYKATPRKKSVRQHFVQQPKSRL